MAFGDHVDMEKAIDDGLLHFGEHINRLFHVHMVAERHGRGIVNHH